MASGAASLRDYEISVFRKGSMGAAKRGPGRDWSKGGFREMSTVSCRKRELLFAIRVPLLIVHS
jgi:hypothetical protein